MIQLFKSNHPSVYLLLLLLAVLVRLGAFLEPDFSQINTSLIAGFFPGVISMETAGTFVLLFSSCLALAVAAILFNSVLAGNELISRSTHVPAAVLIVVSSILPFAAQNPWVPFGLLLLVVSYSQFLGINQTTDPTSSVFFSSIFLALASWFLPWCIPVLLINLVIIGSVLQEGARLAGVAIVAFILPYYFLWTGFMLNDHGYDLMLKVWSSLKPVFNLPAVNISSVIALVVPLLFGGLGVIRLSSSPSFMVLKLRLWYRYSFWFLLVGGVYLFVESSPQPAMATMAVPIALGLNYLWKEEKTSFGQHLVFGLLLALGISGSFSAYNVFVNETLPGFF